MRKLRVNLDDTVRVRSFEINELFQYDAFVQVGAILRDKAEKLQKMEKDPLATKITECRIHDAIFISGDRGSGKTAFMLNIDTFLSKSDPPTSESFKFLKPIDPTILEISEHFLSVVVGHIIETITDVRQEKNAEVDEEMLQRYFDSLDRLSESIKAVRTLKTDQGIDEIISSQTTLKLEQNSHSFFRTAAKLCKKQALVILIDDIDMSLDKGYEVLEVIRKYMSSPYIIPVVSGDPALYQRILMKHFERRLNLRFMSSEGRQEYSPQSFTKYIENLSEKYLIKVFPNENRIALKDIYTVLRESETTLYLGNGNKCFYNAFKDIEIRSLNYNINQKEFTEEVFTNNSRLFVQYLVNKKDIIELASTNYQASKGDAVHKPYNPASSKMKSIDRFIRQHIFTNKSDLFCKSLKKTNEMYSHVRGREILAASADNDLKAIAQGKFNHYMALQGGFFSKQSNPSYKPEPELLVSNMYIRKSSDTFSLIDAMKEDNLLLYALFKLFTYDDFYTSYQTKMFILAGKFFEFMIASLEISSLSMGDVRNILNSTPFNSNINKNKYLADGSDESPTEDFSIPDDLDDHQYQQLITAVDQWRKKTKIRNRNILPTLFLHNAANKFFNNLNVLKMGAYDPTQYAPGSVQKSLRWEGGDESVLLLFQRIVIIFLNSIASFENPSKVTNTNIATGKTFSLKSLRYDNAYRRNIFPLEKDEATFTSAFLSHPLIKELLTANDGTPGAGALDSIFVGGKGVPTPKRLRRHLAT